MEHKEYEIKKARTEVGYLKNENSHLEFQIYQHEKEIIKLRSSLSVSISINVLFIAGLVIAAFFEKFLV